MMSTTFDMYAKSDSLKDHVQEAHTAKSLGKSLLHCTIKTQASTNKAHKAMNAQNHSQSSRALKHREDIKITPIKNPHMEQRTSTNINQHQGRTKRRYNAGENLHQ